MSDLEQTWEAITAEFDDVVLANSLGAEDMVLLDSAWRAGVRPRVLVLETGRLHDETLSLLSKAMEAYPLDWVVQRPDSSVLDQYIDQYGVDGFYDSVQARKACCNARKVQPLGQALSGAQAWVTGQRASQSLTRAALSQREFDSAHQLVKFNPLAEWSTQAVWEYIKSNNVPYNPLHDQHYPSIGCQPCTRAIAAGEDLRAGRWWWENPESKECGLHPIR